MRISKAIFRREEAYGWTCRLSTKYASRAMSVPNTRVSQVAAHVVDGLLKIGDVLQDT